MTQQLVQVTLSIEAPRYKAIAERALTMGHKPAAYLRMLVDAAYAARVQREKGKEPEDRALDSAVQHVFLMADCEPEYVAQALGMSQSLVEKILAGWRAIAGELAETPALPKPEDEAPVDKTVRVAARAGGSTGISRNDQQTIALMWQKGSTASEIGAEVGLDADQVRAFAREHRDLCPARENSATKFTARPAPYAQEDGGYPVEPIRQMWADGLSVRDIAGQIGKTEGALQQWATQHRDVCPKRRP